jgi:hypothetical protein
LRVQRIVCLILFAIIVSGCVPGVPTSTISIIATNPVNPVTSTPLPTSTDTPAPTQTLSPTYTPPPTLTPTLTSTPGPDKALLYLVLNLVPRVGYEGQIFKYNLQTWSSELAEIPDNDHILRAAISNDGKWLAYATAQTLHIFDVTAEIEIAAFDILTRPDHGDGDLIFNKDSSLLAYEDIEGLHIVTLSNLTNRLILQNDLRGLDDQTVSVATVTSYYPIVWSPNNAWLIVDLGKWEGGWPTLLSVTTGQLHEMNKCMHSMEWSSDSRSILGAVAFSGYIGCGEEPGIYRADVSFNGIVEERLYSEFANIEPTYQRDPLWFKLSPNNQWAAFTFLTDFDLQNQVNTPDLHRLLIMSPDGQQGRELVGDRITNQPLWANNSESIYFTRFEKFDSVIYNVDIETGAEKQIATVEGQIVLSSISSDDNWLLYQSCIDYCQHPRSLFLLHLSHLRAVEVVGRGESDIELLGWVE